MADLDDKYFTIEGLQELLKPFGRIESVTMKPEKSQAFVKIATRKEAEQIVTNLHGKKDGHRKIN